MAEKRKLPARAGREPANKKRVSEAAASQSHSKKKAATPRAPSPPPEPVEPLLPSKLKEGEPIPTRRARQPTNLSDKEYQSIAESAVLLTSLERSKKKWLSDGILVRYYTKPKKTKREQIEKLNPPKESMSKVGLCDVTIGPHRFDAMLYTVKDPAAPLPIQYTPPQGQGRMVHYGPPNNFQQYQPHPSNQQRRPYPTGPPGRPQANYSPAPRGPHQPGHAPSPQAGQRPPTQNPPGQPAKPSPDPVIQMLATRAAADPELKALMRVVASSQASQEQLRAFQAHIDELNAIIKAREPQEKRQQNAVGAPPQQPVTPAPQKKAISPPNASQTKPDPGAKAPPHQTSKPQPVVPAQTPAKDSSENPPASGTPATVLVKPQPGVTPQTASQPQTPVPAQTVQPTSTPQTSGPAIKQEPAIKGATPLQSAPPQPAVLPVGASGPATPAPTTGALQSPAVRPTPSNAAQQPTPRPGPPYPPYPQPAYGSQPPLQSRPPQYASPAPYYRPPGPAPPPARPSYIAVVFEFTSPLTPYGNVASGHAGSGDRYLFPEYSILEWLPSEDTILASFLITRKVDPNAPFPIEAAPDPSTKTAKGKGSSKSKKGDKKGKADKGKEGAETPASTDATPKIEPSEKPSAQPGTPSASSEPAKEKEVVLKEYWQPVTFRIHATDNRILDPLTRVVKPAEEVRKYMNEIMDRAERAPDGHLAIRLPHEDAREAFEAESTPALSNAASASRSRPSRGSTVKIAEEESEIENVLDVEEEEEELMDFYGAPLGLPPLRA
ncbi:hypothetical protein N7466_004755 [Penicillium verhagenii]|uniref:uncharacterized protein n=1 Tax=Penicillium verhagenii TaxID=1562060 RepID=UPI002545A9C3|nr:uncharacterized protein N7466_004755 [Penicillium verhagenii]KAJ5935208.1 hypothetical protein N7466_004755 [Penicillium verhagenii]